MADSVRVFIYLSNQTEVNFGNYYNTLRNDGLT